MKSVNFAEQRIDKIKELGFLLSALDGRTKATSQELTLLFNLHNYFNPKKPEYSKHCTTCVIRVYKNCKNIYQQVKDEIQP